MARHRHHWRQSTRRVFHMTDAIEALLPSAPLPALSQRARAHCGRRAWWRLVALGRCGASARMMKRSVAGQRGARALLPDAAPTRPGVSVSGASGIILNWPRGVTVSTLDSESSDRGSNPREASMLVGAQKKRVLDRFYRHRTRLEITCLPCRPFVKGALVARNCKLVPRGSARQETPTWCPG